MLKFLSLCLCLFSIQLPAQQEIPNGKIEHIVAGSVIAVGSYVGSSIFFSDLPKNERRLMARKISLVTVFTAALGREIYDNYKYQKVNAWNYNTRIDGFGDFVTTCLAGMSVTIAITL